MTTDGFAASEAGRRIANLARLGHVAEIDLDAKTVRVEFEDGWTSDHLPVFQGSAGRVAAWSAPIEGEQVLVIAPSGEPGAGVALRGLAYDEFPEPSSAELETVLAAWDDGARDDYDEATGVRRITLAEGGRVEIVGGALSAVFSAEEIALTVGGSTLRIADGAITLETEALRLGGAGGLAVARHGDNVVAGKVVASTSTVKAV